MASVRVGRLVRGRAVLAGLTAAAIAVGVGIVVGAVDAGSTRYIVFSGAPSDAPPQLYRIQSSGGSVEQITTGANAAVSPAFSPGGQRIAFTRLGVGIFTMNPDGSGLRRVTTGPRDSYPAWAPVGGRIAFIRPIGPKWQVYVVSTSGGKPHRLPKAPQAGRPSWTKAGLFIPSGGDLLRIDPKTGRVLKYYGANIDAIWGLNTVALAPNLSKLTFIGARAPEPGDLECGEGPCQRFGLYLESLTPKAKKPQLIVKDAGPAVFSPDGGTLAYVGGGQLQLRSVTSGSTHALDIGTAAPTTSAPPTWQPR